MKIFSRIQGLLLTGCLVLGCSSAPIDGEVTAEQTGATEDALTGAPTKVSEFMNDACSGDVLIARDYDAPFSLGMAGTLMMRPGGGGTLLSDPIPVNGHTYIRWWCHSTSGNFLDPGTWRIKEFIAGASCTGNWDDGDVRSCSPSVHITPGSSAQQGWTAERSRCSSSKTRAVQAMLGPSRQLQFRCLE